MTEITIILSVYNEEEGILNFYNNLYVELIKLTQYHFNLIWINDGSTDNSQLIITKQILTNKNKNIQQNLIEFSKNFGHEAAMLCGIDNSNSEATIFMDTDLQHPPKLIAKLLTEYKNGYQIVLPKRTTNRGQGILKNHLSKLFYILLNRLSDNIVFEHGTSDFFLLSKPLISIFKKEYRFDTRFLRGFIQNAGFKKKIINYNAHERVYGESKYSIKKLLILSFDALFSFSFKPLRITRIIAVIYILFSFILGSYSLLKYIQDNNIPSGYTTIIIFLSISFSLIFFFISIASFYFEKTIDELRKKPSYIIKKNIKHE